MVNIGKNLSVHKDNIIDEHINLLQYLGFNFGPTHLQTLEYQK